MDNTEVKPSQETNVQAGRINNLLKCFSKCKLEFISEKEDCKKLREINAKLQVELKEARELEKSHRYHLLSSREMIGTLQETVSQLVHLKRDIKKMREELLSRDSTILTMEKLYQQMSLLIRSKNIIKKPSKARAYQLDKDNLNQMHNESKSELRKNQERHLEELTAINERKIQQVQHESETQIAQFSCVIAELRSKITDLEVENRDKMNVVVLEYEEKIQRGASQVAQLQEQLAHQATRTDVNIDAYKRRLEELEEKLKQSQFKQYLAQNSYSSNLQYETHVERPYSAQRDYQDSDNMHPVLERNTPQLTQNKAVKPNTLQVMYYDNKTPTPKAVDKKGPFNITKKRKLYNEKDYQGF